MKKIIIMFIVVMILTIGVNAKKEDPNVEFESFINRNVNVVTVAKMAYNYSVKNSASAVYNGLFVFESKNFIKLRLVKVLPLWKEFFTNKDEICLNFDEVLIRKDKIVSISKK